MTPNELAHSYDEIAHVWLEPHIQTNGIAQFERAVGFAAKGGHALDVGCSFSPRVDWMVLRRSRIPPWGRQCITACWEFRGRSNC